MAFNLHFTEVSHCQNCKPLNRILFWDILISFLDTVSDFAQGVVLYSTPEKRLYGVLTLAINWIPGIPAAIHLVSMYRTEFPWYCTLLYAALLIGKRKKGT